MLKVLKRPIKVQTPEGYKSFTGIQKYFKKTITIKTEDKSIDVAELHRFVVDKEEIFAKDLEIGSILQTKEGKVKVIDVSEGPVRDVYDLINVDGEVYYTNDILSHNSFLGSSSTLISSDALKSIDTYNDEDIIFDPKKEGLDAAGLQVIDVTNLPFEQVAVAQLQESYLMIPGRLFELGNYYNNALVVCENNIGESIPSTLFYNYEYEGEIFIELDKNGKQKKEMGIRTTVKTKRLGLTLLKKFIEEGNFIINDRKTLDELFNFIKKKNGTYSAEEGYHDDLVMSLMLTFAPFLDFKNWDNFVGFVQYLEKSAKEKEEQIQESAEFLDLGFGPDDNTDSSPFTEDIWENSDMGITAMEDWNQDFN